MTYQVVFSPEALDQLAAVRRYIAVASESEIASRYVDRIIAFCEKLKTHPRRGTQRDDLLPGLRTIGFKRRVTIVFRIRNDNVVVVGVFYGGRDFEAAFRQN